MEEIILVTPTREYEQQAQEYVREHMRNGEGQLHGACLLEEQSSYDEWLLLLENDGDKKAARPDWVASSTFFALRKGDNKIVGTIDIRHTLNDFLRNYGGHIGYGVRPTERRKGYAGEMLRLALLHCKKLGLKEVLLSCDRENIASRKTIVGAGGVLEREYTEKNGNVVQLYWIALT